MLLRQGWVATYSPPLPNQLGGTGVRQPWPEVCHLKIQSHDFSALYSSQRGPLLFCLLVIWANLQVFSTYTSGGGYVGARGGGYVNFEFLKITAPVVFNQRFEPLTLGSESQCSSTVPSWDLCVKSGDNVVYA